MTRAYIRLDPAFDEHKYAYPDGAYAALVATFCLAELQPDRGRFRSLEYLGRLLGTRGEWAPYLLEHGDVEEQPDGRVYVVGWDEWQEGDHTVGDRMRRMRARKTHRNGVTPPATPTVTEPVTPPVTDFRLGAGAGAGAGADKTDTPDDELTATFLELVHRNPSKPQAGVIRDYLDTFDVSGSERGREVMAGRPEDPIGALIDDLAAFRAQRRDEARREEEAAKRQHRAERREAARSEVARAYFEAGEVA